MGTPLTFQAMNTDFLVGGVSGEAADSVRELVRLAESTFSRFAPGSELGRINRSAGEWVVVSPLTYELLADVEAAFRVTEGLFNPFMGHILREIGYDRSFELLQQDASPSGAAGWKGNPEVKMKQAVQYQADGTLPLDMDPRQQAVRLRSGFSLDMGGFAKGWTAQRAADGLMAKGVRHGLIDAGGDVVLWGREPRQGVWGIGVADPMGTGEDIADLWVEGLTAMATSSVVKRSWRDPDHGAAHPGYRTPGGPRAGTDSQGPDREPLGAKGRGPLPGHQPARPELQNQEIRHHPPELAQTQEGVAAPPVLNGDDRRCSTWSGCRS